MRSSTHNNNNYVTEDDIVRILLNDSKFDFVQRGSYLQQGVCPSCSKKEAYVSMNKPFIVACNRQNKCGWSEHTRELYPDLYNNFEERFPVTPTNPNATADAYLSVNRGFDLKKLTGWYSQELYQLPNKSRTVPTIRFYLNDERTRYWERLIDVTKAEAKQRNNIAGQRKKIPANHKDHHEFNNTLVKGEWWTPPGQVIREKDIVFLVEGIFHAIALHLLGYKVAATIMAGNFPILAMQPYFGKGIQWVWGLDDDKAGRTNMVKHHNRLKLLKEHSGVALTGTDLDWDDLYRRERITAKFIDLCRYRGRLFTARTIDEKAFIWHKKTRGYFTVMEFDSMLYSIDVQKELVMELSKRHIDLGDEEGRNIFPRFVSISPASNIFPQFLYCQIAQFTGDISYDFSIDFANGSNATQISLPGAAIESSTSFNKALLARAAGATFMGKPRAFQYLTHQWFGKKMKTVETINYLGYSKDHGAYIFPDFAYNNGKRVEVNEHGYFQLNKHSVRSNNMSVKLDVSEKFNDAWIEDFYTVYGGNGLFVLAFWVGSLFAEQLREEYNSWPFLEMSGEPGTGKSTVLEFLWRCCGRSDYEGFDPSKATFAARSRALMQVSNLPVVLIEGDRGEDAGKRTGFDYDELKTAFNGRAIRSMGVMNRGSETEEPPFRGTIAFAQNAEIEASPAMLERIVHVHFDKSLFTTQSTAIAPKLEKMPLNDLSGFLHRTLLITDNLLSAIKSNYQESLDYLHAIDSLNNTRLIKNHAQIMSVAVSLPLISSKFTVKMVEHAVDHIVNRCLVRHQRLAADLPLVAKFWEIYELLNEQVNTKSPYQDMVPKERLNHSSDDSVIAINLQQFYQVVSEERMENMPTAELKKALLTSRTYQYKSNNKPIRSKILNKSIRCWIFNKPK